MMGFSAGGRSAAVTIRIGAGSSASDVAQLTQTIAELAKGLDSMKKSAEADTAAVTQLMQRTEQLATRTQAKVKNQAKFTAPAGLEEAYQARVHEQRVQRMQRAVQAPSPVQQEYLELRERQRAHRMQQAVYDASPAGQVEKARKQAAARNIAHAEQAHRDEGIANKIIDAAGWAPGVPGGQNIFYGSMAAKAIGLGGPATLAAMAGIGLMAGGVAAADLTANTTTSGRTLAAISGTAPGDETAIQESVKLQKMGQRYNLTDQQSMGIVTGLAQGGLTHEQNFGEGFRLAANAVQVFQMSIQDATRLVTTSMVDLAHTEAQTAQFLQGIARAALATGAPAASLAKLASTQDLQATVTSGDIGPLLAAFRQVGGTDETAGKLAQLATLHGEAGVKMAQYMGMTPEAANDLRSTPEGAAQYADKAFSSIYGKYMKGPKDDAGYLVAHGIMQQVGGPDFSFTEAGHLVQEGPTPLVAAERGAVVAELARDKKNASLTRLHPERGVDAALEAEAAGNLDEAPTLAAPPAPSTEIPRRAKTWLTEHGLPSIQDAADNIFHAPPTAEEAEKRRMGAVEGWTQGAPSSNYPLSVADVNRRKAEIAAQGDPSTPQIAPSSNYPLSVADVNKRRAEIAAQSGGPSTSPPATYNTNDQAAARDMGTPATPQIAQPAQPAATPQLATYNTNDQAAGVRDINVKGVAEIAVRLLDSLGRTLGVEHISVPLANSGQQGAAYVPRRMGGTQE